MDELGLVVKPQEIRSGSSDGRAVQYGGGARLHMQINGRSLIDLLRDAERPFAEADGQAGLEGKYWPLGSYRFPAGSFHGRPENEQLRFGERVALLQCNCGEIGCWPFLVGINVGHESVVWGDFRQPPRPRWRYEGLGTFVFDRSAYELSVKHAAAEFAARSRIPPARRDWP